MMSVVTDENDFISFYEMKLLGPASDDLRPAVISYPNQSDD